MMTKTLIINEDCLQLELRLPQAEELELVTLNCFSKLVLVISPWKNFASTGRLSK